MILVTGAETAVGRQIIARLRAADEPVRAVVRDPAQAAAGSYLGAELVAANGDWPALLAGVRAVVVGASDPGDEWDHTVLIHAEERQLGLAAAAAAAGVDSYVVVSSLGVGRPGPLGERLEAAAYRAELDARAHNLPLVTLRCAPTFEEILALVAGPWDNWPLFCFGPGDGRLSPLAGADLAAVVVEALRRPELHGRSLDVVGPETYRWRELAGVLGRLTGRRVPLWTVPRWLVAVIRVLLSFVSLEQANRLERAEMIHNSDLSADPTELLAATGVRPAFLADWYAATTGTTPPAAAPAELAAPAAPPPPPAVAEAHPTPQIEHFGAPAPDSTAAPEPAAPGRRPPVDRPAQADRPVVDCDPE